MKLITQVTVPFCATVLKAMLTLHVFTLVSVWFLEQPVQLHIAILCGLDQLRGIILVGHIAPCGLLGCKNIHAPFSSQLS